MKVLYIILPAYLFLFLVYGRKNIKGFLLFTGLMTLPFRTTYSVMSVGDVIAWTGGIMVSLSDISFILLFIYLVINKKTTFKMSPSIALPAFIFVLAGLYSFINSTWPRMTLYQIIFMLQLFFLYYFVLTNAIESEKDVRMVTFFMIASICFQGVLSIAQFVSGYPLDFFSTGVGAGELFTIAEEEEAVRAYGTMGAPNGFAAYIVPLLLLTIALRVGTHIGKKATGLVMTLGGLALLFSFSRGGWLSFVICIMVLLWMMRREQVVQRKTIIGVLFVLAIMVAWFYPEVHARIYGYDRNAAMSRIPLIKIAWNMIQAHPLFGVGANTFASVTHTYTTSNDLKGIYLHEVHNQYLLVFAEMGLFGLFGFLWLMFAFMRQSFSLRHLRNPLFRAVGIGTALGFVAASIHMLVDMFNSYVLIGSMFTFAALVTAIRNLDLKETGAKAGP